MILFSQCTLALLLAALPLRAQNPAPPAPEVDPATIVIVNLNGHGLTLADALATFNASHTGHGALVRGENPLRELCGRMIERELFLGEAEALGIPDDVLVTRASQDYAQALLAERFWKAEVKDKIAVTDADIDAFYARTDVALKITLIQTEKREECEQLRKRVESGEDMSVLATAQSTHESRSFAGKLPYVRRGDLDARLEQPLFALEQAGSLTPVTEVKQGFAFARVDERTVNPDRLPREAAVPQIRKILCDRAEDALRGAAEKRLESEGAIALEENCFTPARIFANDAGSEIAARSAGRELSLAELRDALDIEALRSTEPEKVTEVARHVTRDWAQRQAIWKLSGGEAALAEPEAARKLEGFRREMVLTVLCDRYIYPKEPPSDADLRDFYEKNKSKLYTTAAERRLACIVSGTLQESEELLKRIRAGEDFETLAKQASKDRSSAIHGGRIGWIKQGDILPEVESRVFPQPTGALEGPIETPQGWFLVRVLDRREPAQIPYDSVRSAVLKRLTKQRQQDAYLKWAKSLRERAEVAFDEQGLREAVAWLERQPRATPKPLDPNSPHASGAPAGKGDKP